jgi:hypothetical protein
VGGRVTLVIGALVAGFALAGCGGKKAGTPPAAPSTSTSASTPTTVGSQTTSSPATTGPSANALQAEANSAATGDIPDNQIFLTFRNAAAGYSMKYPEGWAQSGGGAWLALRDKNNIVRVVVAPGGRATAARIQTQLAQLGLHLTSGPRKLTIAGSPGFEVVYTTQSAPNAVTGKRVTLVVDRYYLSHAGKEAIVDLGTPQGVDNVDAYRLMIESFRWG